MPTNSFFIDSPGAEHERRRAIDRDLEDFIPAQRRYLPAHDAVLPVFESGAMKHPFSEVAPGDQPRAPLEGYIGPEPAHQHGNPIAEANQEIDVNDAPKKPGDEAA